MISVKEAKEIISQNCHPLVPVIVPLSELSGRILAADIFSTADFPGFPQSSMDGYAINFEGYKEHSVLKITGKIAAGDAGNIYLNANETARIFTGAPVPTGADTVVMQEKTSVTNSLLTISDTQLKPGTNVRPKGSEIKQGEVALKKNTKLTPAAIGFLAAIGITKAEIYPAPKVCIIITGNELQQPGKPLTHGQVYEANSFALTAALKSTGITEIKILEAKDNLEELTAILKEGLENSDMVLLTGGISVGDYDFVLKATEECEIRQLFHKVKQKPGKPLFFGKKGNKLVFGLPGNPSSVLTCFYQYITLALQKMKVIDDQKTVLAALSQDFAKPAGLTHFLKAHLDGNNVSILSAQESFRMRSFATANCLAEIGEDITELKKGDLVITHALTI